MLIDILFLFLLVLAVFKGFRNGFIVGLFSMLAFVIGLAAAMKLSALVAIWLGDSVNINVKWIPVLSFLLVFIVVVLLVRILASLLRKTAEALMLGVFDRIAGILMYLFIYTVIYSVILFLLNRAEILSGSAFSGSRVYPWIEPVGPYVVNGIGKILPFFQDSFKELEQFFEELAKKAETKTS